MDELRICTVGDLVRDHDAARRPVKASERKSGPTPYYGASGVVDWVEGFTHDGEFLLVSEDGENLRARSTPIAFLVKGKIWVNNHAHVLTGKEQHDTRFLAYALAHADVSGYLTGSAQPKLSQAALKSIKLRLPSSSRRRAIAEVLGALDDKIAANDRTSRSASSLISEVVAASQVRGYQARLSDLVALASRGIAPRYVESCGMVVVNQKCVRDHWVDVRLARRTAESTVRADRVLRRNDVLVNSTGQGTLGRVARWTRAEPEATVDSHITIVRFDESVVDAACAGSILLHMEGRIEALAEGSTGQTELRRDLLGSLELRLPPKGEQSALGAKISSFDDLKDQLRRESERLGMMRDELLPLLMSGKLRVRDIERVVGDAV
jgi:type I restriction enzyme S subunit